MTDKPKKVEISRLSRNILYIALGLSLAVNLFILGATVNFYTAGHPDRPAHRQLDFKSIENRVLRRLPKTNREAIREVFKQYRGTGRELIEDYHRTRYDLLDYLRSDAPARDVLTQKTMTMLEAERALSWQMNRIMIDMVMVSSPEGRRKIARMVWQHSDQHHRPPR